MTGPELEARAAAHTLAIHELGEARSRLAQRRRHAWLDLHDTGITYQRLADASEVSTKIVKEALALARTERKDGSWPPAH